MNSYKRNCAHGTCKILYCYTRPATDSTLLTQAFCGVVPRYFHRYAKIGLKEPGKGKEYLTLHIEVAGVINSSGSRHSNKTRSSDSNMSSSLNS